MSYPPPLYLSYQVLAGTLSWEPPVAAHRRQASCKFEAGRYSYENPPPAHKNHQQYAPRHPAMNVNLSTPHQFVSPSNNILSQTVNAQSIHKATSNQLTVVGQLIRENRVPVGNSFATLSVVRNFSHQNNVEKSKGGSRIHCKICDRAFTNRCYLTQHNNAHHRGDKPFKCKKCGKRYFTNEDLDAHAEKHNESKKCFTCDYCPKTFNYLYDLNRHKSFHTGRGLSTCSCGKLFARRDHMVKHALRFSCKQLELL